MARRVRRTWPLALAGAVAFVLLGGLVALQPYITPLSWVVRTCALLGYLCLFAAIGISAYMRYIVRAFGRPFVQVHHMLSITGLVLLTLHPLAVVQSFGRWGVLVPALGSWVEFLRWGGPPAWYLIGLASLAALSRSWLRQQWRYVHQLNYVAFLLATVHAILLGSDFRSTVAKVVASAMALGVIGILLLRRRQQRQLQQRRQQARVRQSTR
jgi:sulfoxide reductase heme-binding subunit YedZ